MREHHKALNKIGAITQGPNLSGAKLQSSFVRVAMHYKVSVSRNLMVPNFKLFQQAHHTLGQK